MDERRGGNVSIRPEAANAIAEKHRVAEENIRVGIRKTHKGAGASEKRVQDDTFAYYSVQMLVVHWRTFVASIVDYKEIWGPRGMGIQVADTDIHKRLKCAA